MAEHDAIVVGSGVNGLACAALLARGGWDVCVLERNDWFGGAIRTAEITAPGFKHDVFSAWHPLWVGGAGRESSRSCSCVGVTLQTTARRARSWRPSTRTPTARPDSMTTCSTSASVSHVPPLSRTSATSASARRAPPPTGIGIPPSCTATAITCAM